MTEFNTAIEFIEEKHKGQTRMGGEPYSTHPIQVSKLIRAKGLPKEMILAAYFHDLLEDTDATEEEILALSSEKVLEAVKLLTKYPGYDMDEYMDGISNNDIALHVKLADRIHNLNSARVASDKFREKYILETEKHYLKLSEGTIFEEELKTALERLKDYGKAHIL